MADVRVVNMRDEWAEAGEEVIVSRLLAAAMTARLDAGEQSLVLLNRRGIAAAVLCRQCGSTVECPHCSVSMTVHGSGARAVARCHYCDFSERVPPACPNCAAPYLEHVGFGTERVEAEVRARFPSARLGRVDRDTVRRRGSLAALLARFARRELDVLVGTQMIAKGHDFPHVTLVGVISADVGLGLPDFRAAERTFQLITQVVGRAGRGERAGEAIVQTLFPDHYAVRCGSAQDYDTFAAKELSYRERDALSADHGMINVVVRGRRPSEAMRAARPWRAHAGAAAASLAGRARSGAGAADQAARGISRAVLPEGRAAGGCATPCAPRWRRIRRWCAARRSTSIR